MSLREKINKLGHQQKPFLFISDFLLQDGVVVETCDLIKEGIHIQFPDFQTPSPKADCAKIELSKQPISFETYRQMFDQVQQHLHYGNSFLVNLTAETPIQTAAEIADIYQAAEAKYKLNYQNKWVCFSPESFICIRDQQISSFPMKGTIDADIPDAAAQLLADPKELAEHYTIVDLIRNDLSKVAKNVEVKRFRYLDTLYTSGKTLLQASSEITGTLPENWASQLGDILFELLPAGSISGAPKQKTIEIIKECEQYERGFYTGVAFLFDGHSLDSCVLIRFIEQKQIGAHQQLVYKSGGGITIHSNPQHEYDELLQKIYVPGI